MTKRSSIAALAAGVLALLAVAGPASALTVFTETNTLTNDLNGSSVQTAVIGGSWGTEFFSNGIDIDFSNVMVSVNDQGQQFTYDFSYNCIAGKPGCTTNPTVPSQYPGGSGSHVSYTVNTGQVPGCPFPKLGQTTSCSATVNTSVSDFIFGSSGAGFLTETFSLQTVPEPAEWALMLTGFGAAGAVLRRRRTLGAA
jgi:hypothetical protein